MGKEHAVPPRGPDSRDRRQHSLVNSVERSTWPVVEDRRRSHWWDGGAAPKPQSQEPKEERTLDSKTRAAISWLGERWLLHPVNAPKKGRYNLWGKEELNL